MKLSRSLQIWSLIFTLVLAVFPVEISTHAQDETPTRPIYVMQDNHVLQWNFDTLQSRPVIALGGHFVGENAAQANARPAQNVLRVALDASQQHVFRIDSLGANRRERTAFTRLVRADLRTNEEIVLMERPNMFQFQVSPLADRVLVLYYEGQAERSRYVPCMLDMASLSCKDMGFNAIGGNHAIWLDDQTIAMLTAGRRLTLIDAQTFQLTMLSTPDNLWINSFAPIPDTRQFILGVNRYDAPPATPIEFYTLDRDTQSLEKLPLGTPFDPHTLDGTTVTAWLFSPDGRYLLFGNLGQTSKLALVEFQTGHLVGTFEEVTQATWLDDGRLLFLQGFRQPAPLSEFNLSTGQVRILIPDARGMAILN